MIHTWGYHTQPFKRTENMKQLDLIRALNEVAEGCYDDAVTYEAVENLAQRIVDELPKEERGKLIDEFAWGRFEEVWAVQQPLNELRNAKNLINRAMRKS